MPRQKLKPRKDGRYVCRYKDQWFYGDSPTEATQKRDEYKKQLERGLRAEAAGITVSQYSDQWVSTYKAGVGDKTYNSYVHFLHILCAECGDKRLQDVVPSDIQRVYNSRIGKSKSDIRKLALTVKGMFDAALKDRLIVSNPALQATPPNGKAGTHRALEPWEKDIIDQMTDAGHRFAVAAAVMLYAGLRRGEVLALRVDRDIDFKARTITVREAVKYTSNQPVLGDPKSEAGMRTIPMLDKLAKILEGKSGLLLSMRDGGPLTETAFSRLWESYLYHCSILANEGRRKRWVGKTKADKEALERGEQLPEWKEFSIRTHDLRHTYCTMLYEAGVDLKTAQKWMGHADQTMTMRIYTHLSAKQEAAATEKFRQAMEP